MRTQRTRQFAAVVVLGALPCLAGAKGPDWKGLERKPDAWYRSAEGARVAANVLSNQSPRGDWPKNGDTTAGPYTGDREAIHGTFDNGATVGEVRFLARAFRETGRAEERDAVIKGVDHILKAQYPTGGWPQTYPPGKRYARHITFNDNTMVNLMTLLREVATSDRFEFVGEARRAKAGEAFEAGVKCILRCQVVAGGVKTAWCAQHDETTLEPRPARAFELVGLSGSESVGILMLLMSIEKPGPEIVGAVDAGVRWFEAARLTGIRETTVGGDKVIVADPGAPALWARFYEIGTNRPFFAGRDGVKRYNIAEIEAERRNGYAWYGDWGRVLLQQYPKWKARHSAPAAKP